MRLVCNQAVQGKTLHSHGDRRISLEDRMRDRIVGDRVPLAEEDQRRDLPISVRLWYCTLSLHEVKEKAEGVVPIAQPITFDQAT